LQLAACVQKQVQEKVDRLNYLTKLEASKLNALYKCALEAVKAAVGAYQASSSANSASKLAEQSFQQWLSTSKQQNSLSSEQKAMSEWQLRSQAQSIQKQFLLSRSLRVLASRVHDANQRAAVLRERLCVLLALRDGAEPHVDYPPAAITLHSASVDSVAGVGIVELKQWLHETCMQLKFMGELLPKTWLDVAHVLPSLSDGVLTMVQATDQVRSSLTAASVNFGCSDEEIARILRFWSRVGDIFM
jgi:ribonuclease HI